MRNPHFSSRRHYLRPRFEGAVRVLILVNAAIFFLQIFIPRLATVLGLVPVLVLKKYYFWQLVTYMFLHGGFLHLIFNMFILWMFGSELEATWGRNMFLRYYFITGIGAGLVYVLARFNSVIPTIGASGAIFGLLLAFGLTFPNRYVYLYFFIPIKAKYLVLIFGAIEFFAAFAGAQDNIAHFAHLGGLLVGFLYLKVFRGRGGFWRRLVFTDRPQKDADVEVDDTDFEDKVNQVLRKLSKVGLDGLTSYEKEILEEARKRYRQR
jgi:membrane associated rhomboid family serine protease